MWGLIVQRLPKLSSATDESLGIGNGRGLAAALSPARAEKRFPMKKTASEKPISPRACITPSVEHFYLTKPIPGRLAAYGPCAPRPSSVRRELAALLCVGARSRAV